MRNGYTTRTAQPHNVPKQTHGHHRLCTDEMSAEKNMTIAVAISGGTDSMYALLSLKEAGHDVIALHAHFLPPSTEREAALQAMCDNLGIPFHAVDLHEEFERCVVHPFINAYTGGNTPNPCALCNATMKFGALLREAEALGATSIATGHYARLEEHPQYGVTLARGVDVTKDQSYFLSLIPKTALARAIFPLGLLTKEAIKADLRSRGLTPPYPSESQEICFVPDDDYRQFLRDRHAVLTPSGPMKTLDGKTVGRHNGLWNYTEGQRRGLGVAWKEPLYVIRKDTAHNVLYVDGKKHLAVRGVKAEQVNLLAAQEAWPATRFVRVRYRQKELSATVEVRNNVLHVTFTSPQPPPAAGQICTVYDEAGYILAGGVISEILYT